RPGLVNVYARTSAWMDLLKSVLICVQEELTRLGSKKRLVTHRHEDGFLQLLKSRGLNRGLHFLNCHSGHDFSSVPVVSLLEVQSCASPAISRVDVRLHPT